MKLFSRLRVGGATTEVVNIGLTNKGTLFPFNTTTTLKKLPKRSKKWFDAREYFASTVGLSTGYMVTIDHTPYRVMRMDRKRGKVWMAPSPNLYKGKK